MVVYLCAADVTCSLCYVWTQFNCLPRPIPSFAGAWLAFEMLPLSEILRKFMRRHQNDDNDNIPVAVAVDVDIAYCNQEFMLFSAQFVFS